MNCYFLKLILTVKEQYLMNNIFSPPDEIKLYYFKKSNSVYEPGLVPLLKHGIAWPTDKSVKFRNPPGDNLQEGKKLC